MKRYHTHRIQSYGATIFALALAVSNTLAEEPKTPDDKAPVDVSPPKALALLADDKLEDVARVEINGENPRLIYIPITHDNPEHAHAAGGTDEIEMALTRGQIISEHLFANYGVRKILLEGISKTLSDKYNSPEFKKRKLSVGTSKSVTFKVWFDLLNKNEWQLVPAYEKNIFGPLTILGAEYTTRIYKALDEARNKGWFKTREAFQTNQVEFKALTEQACEGYNMKRKKILEADPGLRNEYDITVIQRNKVFIDNILETKEPGIIMCGGGHIQDLIDQLKQRGVSYLIVVPKGIGWPPVKKDDDKIYSDMLELGCQLRKCNLGFGDGGAAQINLPIE